MPIDDWIYWGEDPWYAGVIWKEWIDAADILCTSTVNLDVTYTAAPTADISSDSTVAVDDTFIPQAGASITSVHTISDIPTSINADASIASAHTIGDVSTSINAAPNTVSSTSTTTVNETHTLATPDDFGGLILWLDADDGSTVWEDTFGDTAEINDDVQMWRDKSGAGNHLTPGANEPKYEISSGELRVSFTSGNSDYMERKPVGTTMDGDTFIIFAVTAGTGDFAQLSHGTLGSPISPSWVLNKTAITILNDNEAEETASASASTTGWQVYSVSSTNIGIETSLGFSDFEPLIPYGISGDDADAFSVGRVDALDGGGISYWSGSVYELIIYNQDIGDDAILSVIAYLEDKWSFL